MDKISVIVPMYKVEKYLRKCVDSILAQTYQNLEVILVDDGSPDGCPAICDEYAKKDKRVKVIHKLNGGLSDARNAGLDIATGEYIGFVDSDDYIVPNMYEELYNAIKKYDCDLAVSDRMMVDEQGNVVHHGEDSHKAVVVKDNVESVLFDDRFAHKTVPAWNKLYARHIFDTLRYPKGRVYEDLWISLDVYRNAKKGVVLLEDRLYVYLLSNNSITRAKPTRRILQNYESSKHVLDKIDKKSSYYDAACASHFSILQHIYKMCRGNKELQNEIFDIFKKEFKEYKCKLNFKRKIKYFLFRYLRIAI